MSKFSALFGVIACSLLLAVELTDALPRLSPSSPRQTTALSAALSALPYRTNDKCEAWIEAKTQELGISIAEVAQKIVAGYPQRLALEFIINCMPKNKAIASTLVEKAMMKLSTASSANASPAAKANKQINKSVERSSN